MLLDGTVTARGSHRRERTPDLAPEAPCRAAMRHRPGVPWKDSRPVSAQPLLASLRASTQTHNRRRWNHSDSVASVAVTVLSSVSYTHLRAHETKANLVCRLLL